MQLSSRSATRLSSNVVRKARRRCPPHISSASSSLRAYATVSQRPYEFHIGASWAGKPEPPGQRPKVPFPANGLIGAWRDKMLALRQDTLTQDAGEDFLFIQQVITIPLISACQGIVKY